MSFDMKASEFSTAVAMSESKQFNDLLNCGMIKRAVFDF